MKCLECKTLLVGRDKTKFCSLSCSATYNNKLRPKKKLNKCLNCKKETKYICCSRKCNEDYKWKQKRVLAENDVLNTIKSYGTKVKIVKRYLIEIYGNKCMECSWKKVNPTTKKVPIELEHIDGKWNNFEIKNLKLLCPNCHSLTPTFRALNIGNGCKYRK